MRRTLTRWNFFIIFIALVFYFPNKAVLAEKISIGVPGLGVAYFPLIAAMYKGFMAGEGLEPTFIVMRTGVITSALLSGDLDYTSSGSAVFNAGLQGLPIKALMVLTGKPQHALVVKKPEIKSVNDMAGRSIAVTTGNLELMAIETFKKHRLDPKKDLKLVYSGDPAARFAAVETGVVDGAVLDLVGTVKAENAGMRILQNIAEIMDMPLSALGASDRKIKENPSQVKRLVRATLRGIRFYTDRRNRDEVIAMISKWSKIEPSTARRVYDLGVISTAPDGKPTDEGLRNFTQLAAKGDSSGSYEALKTKLLNLEPLAAALNELR
ncbi:MAG: ABC transporter substrate-binding protein [Candidatus Binatia bacterium]